MTRSCFEEEIVDFCDLISFCSDEGCGITADIITADDIGGWIDDDIVEFIRYNSWQDLRDILSDLPDGYEYYLREGSLTYIGLGDFDFDDYKDQVFEWANDRGVFDEEEIEEATDEGSSAPKIEIGDYEGVCYSRESASPEDADVLTVSSISFADLIAI